MPRISRRWWQGVALAGFLAIIVLVVVGGWVVPALIAGRVRSTLGVEVTIGGWWINRDSAGISDLVIHEGPGVDSPILARADRVTTDLSIGSVLRGDFQPTMIRLDGPAITVRLDRDGHLRADLPIREPAPSDARETGASPWPSVTVVGGRLSFEQEGRGAMVVTGLQASLETKEGLAHLSASADDPTWGRLVGEGQIATDLSRLDLNLRSDAIQADPTKARSLPFVPEATWEHVLPTGPLAVTLSLRKPEGTAAPLVVRTLVHFDRTMLELPSLGLETRETTGRMVIEGGLVRLEDMKGRAIDGQVSATGTLDFGREPPRIALDLDLQDVDVARTPESWRLGETGLTGRMDGKAHLIVDLTREGADLTGSTGEAVLTQGTIGEIPFKSLKLTMEAEGSELRYESLPSAASWLRQWLTLRLVAFQSSPDAPTPSPAKSAEAPRKGGLILPKSITTEVEFEDVDLTQVLAKGEALGLSLPFVLAGELSLKAKATIPLGRLRDVAAYTFHGEATLKGAHVAGIDLGRLSAGLDLEDGVLTLDHLKGQLVNLPEGGLKNRPEPTEEVPDDGPLPSGGFRGRLRAELAPPGSLKADLLGLALPLGEIAAPALPKPTPLDGLVDLNLSLVGDLERASDPKAWTLDGRIRSRRITYQGATLDAVETGLSLREGRFELSEFQATLDGQPLRAGASVTLAKPYPFEGNLNVQGWELARVLALVPSVPRPSPVDGRLQAEMEIGGDFQPLHVQSHGHGRLERFQTGPVGWGDVPIHWDSGHDSIEVSIDEAHPFGGTLSARALIPSRGDGPIQGSATLVGIDTAAISRAIPGEDLQLSGRADGRLRFTIRPVPDEGTRPVEADLQLEAPNLSVQGIPANALKAVLTIERGVLRYDLYTEGLGGKIKFKGELPISLELGATLPTTEALFQAAGFGLDAELWRALGVSGALARLRGRGAVVANLRYQPTPSLLWARGIAEFRELSWGPSYPIGQVRGVFSLTPERWEIDPLTGTLFGGAATGEVTTEPPSEASDRPIQFRFAIQRADLERIAAIEPGLAGLVMGKASARLAGQLGQTLQGSGELLVPDGRLVRLPLRELRAPLELSFAPGPATGTVQSRRWTARLAGGHLGGDALFRFGSNRSFRTEFRLANVDLEAISRAHGDQRRPASGQVSGLITLRGLDTLRPETFQGRADLDLADASVLSLPVFNVLDRFLGGPAGGGVFEEGRASALIGNRQIRVEELTLLGRVAQLHAEGTIGFNQELDLDVLINTNQIIPQTGQALLAVIPGLRQATGSAAASRVANFFSNRLIKLHVGGTLRSPTVAIDPTVTVTNAAVSFFAGALKLPLGILR